MFLLQEILKDFLQDSTLNDVPDKGCPAGHVLQDILQDRLPTRQANLSRRISWTYYSIYGVMESVGLAIIRVIIGVILKCA